jgi:transposase
MIAAPIAAAQLRNFGEDVAEILERIPATFKVIRHVRPKFACKQCERVVEAPAPSRTIERGLAGPGLAGACAGLEVCRSLPTLSPVRDICA